MRNEANFNWHVFSFSYMGSQSIGDVTSRAMSCLTCRIANSSDFFLKSSYEFSFIYFT
jgi:hypothetical protein